MDTFIHVMRCEVDEVGGRETYACLPLGVFLLAADRRVVVGANLLDWIEEDQGVMHTLYCCCCCWGGCWELHLQDEG